MRSSNASLQVLVNHGLLKRFGTVKIFRIVSSAMSLKMEVNKDIGSSASVECCIDAEIHPSLPSPTSIFEVVHHCPKIIGNWSLPQGSGTTFQKKSMYTDRLQRVRFIKVYVPLAG